MELYIVLTVIITSIIQSLFGVGVLLFGTPILLLLGYPFLESLLVLLPISASINLLQVVKDYKSIELKTYKRVIYITVPFIVIFLFIIAKISIDVTFFIGVFLLLISLKDNVNIIKICLDKLLYFDKSYYLFMGIIHGITNLGGALLTAKIFSLELNKYLELLRVNRLYSPRLFNSYTHKSCAVIKLPEYYCFASSPVISIETLTF